MSPLGVVQSNYRGAAAFTAVEGVRQAFVEAVASQDWQQIRRLDRISIALVDKVIAANPENPGLSMAILDELKRIYRSLISTCQQQAASIAL